MKKKEFFDIDKNILSYGKKSNSFNTAIHQIICSNETAYIVLSKIVAPKTVVEYLVNNIYCVDKDLNILWQVCDIKGKVSPIYYDHIVKMDDRFIYAEEFMGKKYIIDRRTGHLKGYIDFCGEYEDDKIEVRIMYK